MEGEGYRVKGGRSGAAQGRLFVFCGFHGALEISGPAVGGFGGRFLRSGRRRGLGFLFGLCLNMSSFLTGGTVVLFTVERTIAVVFFLAAYRLTELSSLIVIIVLIVLVGLFLISMLLFLKQILKKLEIMLLVIKIIIILEKRLKILVN